MKEPRPPIFCAGVGPLPPENPDRLFAPGLRIWGIARQLLARGHRLRLATVQFWGAPLEKVFVFDLSPGCDFPKPRVLDLQRRKLAEVFANEAREFGAVAAIGSTDLVNRELAQMETDIPLWCDYFGDPMAERQMLARLHESDDGLADQWKTLAPALRRADRVSGCSTFQVGALLGEMATLGRLNRHTAAERLANLVPPWLEPIPPASEPGPFLRGVAAPADSFLVFQSGGFNTWLDVETLFAALEIAMRRLPKLRFACTGGAIPGHNEKSFARFQSLVASSPNKDRYHLLGWIPLGRVPRIIQECDLGLNVDLPSAEGWLGTRNRIMDWIMGRLPVVSTIGCELTLDLAEIDYVVGVEQADAEAVASAIVQIAERPEKFRAQTLGAQKYLREEYSPEKCLSPLMRWASNPQSAGDLREWRRVGGATPSELWRRGNEESSLMAENQELVAGLARLEKEMKTLKGSSLVRAAMKLRKGFGRS